MIETNNLTRSQSLLRYGKRASAVILAEFWLKMTGISGEKEVEVTYTGDTAIIRKKVDRAA